MSFSIVFFGTYRFRRKRVGFRPDVCLSCGADAIAHEYRSFDVGHFWFLPLLPFGMRSHWYCSACGEDPRGERLNKVLKVVYLLAVLAFAGVAWFVPTTEDIEFVWALRIGMPLLALWIVRTMRTRRDEDHSLRERLRGLRTVGDACPICTGHMVTGRPRRCRTCGAIEGRAPELAAS